MNRLILALPLLLGAIATPCGAQQEWDTSGIHIYNTNTGSVGIGIQPTDFTIPKLELYTDAKDGMWVRTNLDGATGIYAASYGSNPNSIAIRASCAYGIGVRAFSENKAIFAVSNLGTAIHAQTYQGLAGLFDGDVEVNGVLDVPELKGFVGVGRSTPITSSEVFGTHGNTSGYSGMYASTSSSVGKPFYGYAAGGTADAYHYFDGSTNTWRLVVGGGYRLTVANTGRVGVGIVTPSYTLHVNGSAGKPGGGSWSNASDLRLKKDVQDLTGSLDKLLSLRGVTYEYKDPESIHELHGVHTGVIAQEVEQVFPEWVDEAPDGYKRVTYRGFEALTVEAMRELQQENQDLRDRLADLEAVVAALQER